MDKEFPDMDIKAQQTLMRRLVDTAGNENAKWAFTKILDSLVRLEYLENKSKLSYGCAYKRNPKNNQ